MPLPDFPIPGQAPKQPMPGAGMPINPVEVIQKNHLINSEKERLMRASAVHGQHAALRMMMERNLLSQHRRLPGLRSNLVGLSESMGLDDDFAPEDMFYQNEECPVARMGTRDIHSMMEDRLGMNVSIQEVTNLDLTGDAHKSFACSMAL
jgi:hypothetical protein